MKIKLLIILSMYSLLMASNGHCLMIDNPGKSLLSPSLIIENNNFQAQYQLYQKTTLAFETNEFLNAVSQYIRTTGQSLPIAIVNKTVLLPAIIHTSDLSLNSKIPLTVENLNVLIKLIARQKILLRSNSVQDGKTSFDVISFNSDITEIDFKKTAQDTAVWKTQIDNFTKIEPNQKDKPEPETQTNQTSLMDQLINMCPNDFFRICSLFNALYSGNATPIDLMPIYAPIKARNDLPAMAVFFNNIAAFDKLNFVNSFFKVKEQQTMAQAQQKMSAKNFKILAETEVFKQGLSKILHTYYNVAGEEDGTCFLDSNQVVPMMHKSMLELALDDKSTSAIASIHTHFIALYKIDHLFFLPSHLDILASIAYEHQNIAILWGDAELGFYLTVIDALDPELRRISYPQIQAKISGNPMNLDSLNAYIEKNYTNFKYYKLLPNGTRMKRGLAFNYSIHEIPFPQEILNKIPAIYTKATDRVLNFWKDEQILDIISHCDELEKSGKTSLLFLEKKLAEALTERDRLINEKRPKNDPYTKAEKKLEDPTIIELLFNLEIKMQDRMITAIQSLINNKTSQQKFAIHTQDKLIQSSI